MGVDTAVAGADMEVGVDTVVVAAMEAGAAGGSRGCQISGVRSDQGVRSQKSGDRRKA